MRLRLPQHLYLRIWLAVVAAITVMTMLLGWMWRTQWEHDRLQRPGREVVVRDADGDVVGRAPARLVRGPSQTPEFDVTLDNGEVLTIQLPRPPRAPGDRVVAPWSRVQSLGAYVLLLVGVAVAVALSAYPIVRRLTQRLETLQAGVERWGQGDLSARVPVQGQDEVAFLARRFNAAADRVQALLTAHKTLLANASHELRSPLARIRMGLELLGPDGASAAHRAEMARNVAELDELIDEILLASRLDLSDAGAVDALGPLEEVDLLGLAAEECARTGAQLELAAGAPPAEVRGSARLLRRLLRNLLENARRHGHRDGAPAEVELRLTPVAGASGPTAGWEVAVSDQGPGIPDAWRERIFEPFFRLPGASEREGGVGLGLALVRTIAERHGGNARCESSDSGGARLVIFLPKNF